MRMRPSRERGVALVLVLWLATLLMVVASDFLFATRTDALVIRNSLSMARAESIADAAINRAAFEVYRIDNGADIWRRDGVPRAWAFDGARVRIEMRDESARIDINTASDALLKGLLVSTGLNDEESSRLLDAILDWRDPDSLKRPNGAEEGEYRAAGLAYRPANAPFQAIEEIQLVLGMRPEIFRRVAPMITVFSRQTGVNTLTATREVLLAIPGLTAETVDAYIARREEARAKGQPLPAFPEAGGFASPPNSQVITIRAEARLEDGSAFVREAVALMRPVPRRPVTYLAWREVSAPATEPAAGAAIGVPSTQESR